jgi:hypothetical protein
VRDPADRSFRWRRRLAYPILTLTVAGVVYWYSQGTIATTRPASEADYLAFAREVMVEVREGRAIPKAIDPLVETAFRAMAPASVRDAAAGELAFEDGGFAEPGGGTPHIRTVVVRAPDGAGVGLSISILGGRPEVVGVSRVDPLAKEATP